MADFTIAAGDVAVHDKTLSAGTADNVAFTQLPNAIHVLWDGAAKGYVQLGAIGATVAGAGTYEMPAVPCERVFHVRTSVVSLVSPGTPMYSVMGA
jgi:hypothetical protein